MALPSLYDKVAFGHLTFDNPAWLWLCSPCLGLVSLILALPRRWGKVAFGHIQFNNLDGSALWSLSGPCCSVLSIAQSLGHLYLSISLPLVSLGEKAAFLRL